MSTEEDLAKVGSIKNTAEVAESRQELSQEFNRYDLLNITRDYVLGVPSSEALEAHREAIEAQKAINRLRPQPPANVSIGGNICFNASNEILLILSVGIIPILSSLPIALNVVANLDAYIASLLIAPFGFFLLRSIGSFYNPYNSKKQRIKKFLSKVFLSKEKREYLIDNYRKHKEYMIALESYQLFIDAKLSNLQQSGALSLIAQNCDMPLGKDITINKFGEFQWCRIQEVKDKNPNNIALTASLLSEIESERKKLAHLAETSSSTSSKKEIVA